MTSRNDAAIYRAQGFGNAVGMGVRPEHVGGHEPQQQWSLKKTFGERWGAVWSSRGDFARVTSDSLTVAVQILAFGYFFRIHSTKFSGAAMVDRRP